MADQDSDITQGAVPNPHRGEIAPPPDAHTRPAPDAAMTRPDQQEELGPIEGLVHAASVEATAEVTGDPEAEAEAQRLGIEAEGVESAQIFSVFLATIITLALSVIGVFWLVFFVAGEEQVARDGEAFYPEIVDVRARATELLTQYGRTEDTYRITIDDAMTLVAADYADAQAADLMEAPANYRTVYLSDYFDGGGFYDDSGFEPPVPAEEPDDAPAVTDETPAPADGAEVDPEES